MLNPLNYLDVSGIDESEDKLRMWFRTNRHTPDNVISDLDPKRHADIIKQLDELPFIGIVVKNERKGSPLGELVKAFGQGKHKKIIEVEPGHLEDGVREAIKLHAEQNPKFARELSPDLREEIGIEVLKKTKHLPLQCLH